MKLSVLGRNYYRLTITTSPAAVAGWSASFDGGTTWVAGTAEGGSVYSWLLDTPSTLDGAGLQGAHTVQATKGSMTRPILRCDDVPELVIADVPDDCLILWE